MICIHGTATMTGRVRQQSSNADARSVTGNVDAALVARENFLRVTVRVHVEKIVNAYGTMLNASTPDAAAQSVLTTSKSRNL